MTVAAAILVVISLWLAVLLGPDLTAWVWGPALLALGLAVLAVLRANWQRSARAAGGGMLALACVVVVWFAGRAWASAVADSAMADGLLLAVVVGGFVVMVAIQDQLRAERVVVWGVALLVLASAVVVARQVVDAGFTPGFFGRFALPSGFFGHYSDGSTFLTGAACLVGGAALAGWRYHKLERWLWGLIAVAGMLAVYFTRSRGGICGAAVALGVFAVMALIIGKHRGARWFAPGIVTLPVIGLVVVGFLIKGWSDAQAVRNQGAGIEGMMDNGIRLNLIGIAVSCVGLHPWQGGGSRSFSWECYRFWELDAHGPGSNRPEQVHNEILQAAADYGIAGAGLLGLLVGAVVVVAVVRAAFPDAAGKGSNGDSWRLGGVAGLAGILIQSNFSFVFHLVPGALLLGMCLGSAAHPGAAGKPVVAVGRGRAILASVMALGCAAMLLPWGWLGTRVTSLRWADQHGKRSEISPEASLAALSAAIRMWPLGEFYEERAAVFQKLSAQQAPGSFDKAAVARAVDDYAKAAALNPFVPGPVVNRANLLGLLGKDAEAIEQFDRAIALEGGMEAGFKAAYSKAEYLRLKAERLLAANRVDEALVEFSGARETLVKAYRFPSGDPLGLPARELRVKLGERLCVLLSLAGRDREAGEEFESSASVWGGSGIRFLQSWHLRRQANRVMYERKPSEALALFLKARTVLDQSAGLLPTGVTPDDCAKLRDDLDMSIAFLKGAHVEAAETPAK